MGIYIPGMEMPKTGEYRCVIRKWGEEITIDLYGEEELCGTLLPVPDHGDLIDRNVLYAKIAEWEQQAMHLANTSPDARTFDKWSNILAERSAFKFDIADAPTVIEADRGGDA